MTRKPTQKITVYKDPDKIRSMPKDFSQAVDEFLRAQDIRSVSKEVYRKGVMKFLKWAKDLQISSPDKETILEFKGHLAGLQLSVNTCNSYLVAVKRFFAFLHGKYGTPDIAADVKGFKQPRKTHLREALTVEQVKLILEGVDKSTLQGQRDFSIFNLLARTGLRSIEVVRANIEDIRQQGGEALLFVHGKGRDSKDEFVLLTQSALQPILDYLKGRGKVDPAEPLFASCSNQNKGQRITTRAIRRITEEEFKKAGIDQNKKLSCHSFRHFFATMALKNKAPLHQVRESMRHASLETTQRYLHTLDRIEDAAERYVEF